MGKLRIAVATNGNDELKDVVSNFFGIANTFTIVDVENGKIENTTVIQNSLPNLLGAGLIVVQMLVDRRVDIILANKPNIWVAEQSRQRNITYIQIKPSTSVEKAIKKVLDYLMKSGKKQHKPLQDSKGELFSNLDNNNIQSHYGLLKECWCMQRKYE